MKKLILLSILFIVGCEGIYSPNTQWICTTDYQFESDLPEGCGSTDEPPCPVIRDLSEYIDQRIYKSLDECERVCPADSLEITSLDYPDGIGKYFTTYCAKSN